MKMEKGAAIAMLLGAAILAAGVVRIILHRHFSLSQAAYCLLAIPAALFLLMVFDYTLHHARAVSVMVVVIILFWIVVSPNFCVGMGIALLGMMIRLGR